MFCSKYLLLPVSLFLITLSQYSFSQGADKTTQATIYDVYEERAIHLERYFRSYFIKEVISVKLDPSDLYRKSYLEAPYRVTIETNCETVVIDRCVFNNFTEASGSVVFMCTDHLSKSVAAPSNKYFKSFIKARDGKIVWKYQGKYSQADGLFYKGKSRWKSNGGPVNKNHDYIHNEPLPYSCDRD